MGLGDGATTATHGVLGSMVELHARRIPTQPTRERRSAKGWAALALSLPALLCAQPAPASGRERDPGIRIEVDRDAFEIRTVDLASGELGPDLRVATGSPAHPTPAGRFRLRRVVHAPAWVPGETARAGGARPEPPSTDGPLGIAKIPIHGEVALHGGANRFSVGKPLTLGCLRTTDDEIASLIDWLEQRDALRRKRPASAGDGLAWQDFARPIRIEIR